MEHIPKIIIKPIDSENQRYPTCGDWLYDAEDNAIEVRVNRMSDWRSEIAVVVHELIEALCCIKNRIPEVKVMSFDIQYEKERAEGKHSETDEPGDDPNSPYHLEHVKATSVEKETCLQLNLNWDEHQRNVNEWFIAIS